MVDLEALRAALEAVLDDLASQGPEKLGPIEADLAHAASAAGDDQPATSEYSQALQRLSEYLSGGVDEAGEALSAHPFVAVSAAFLLGVAVGRISRG